MKIVKPLDLGILQKPYRYRRRHHFVVSALGFFRLGESVERFLREYEQWPAALQALPAGEALDIGMPKAHGEFLLAGAACAPNGEPVTRMTVRAAVGTLDKRLVVVGDRAVTYGLVPRYRVAPPVPFTEMPLGYERAYGGPDYAPNPAGRGYAPQRLPVLRRTGGGLMPNVEYPHEPVRSHRHHYTPAGFGPLDIRCPARQARAGTYDQAWLDSGFPGLPDDVQWTLFNAAPDDQQLDGYFAGGEPYRLEGMHPSKPAIEGNLPAMRVRAFVQRRGEPVAELAMAFDTVWFFPAQELGVAIYRGQTGIEDSDALDVESVLLAYERLADAPRAAAHYVTALRERTDPETAALHLMNAAPLVPEVAPAERAAAAARRQQVEAEDLARRQAWLDEHMEELWAKSGMTPPEGYVPPKVEPLPLPLLTPQSIENGDVNLAEVVATATALAEDARRQGEEKLKELEEKKAQLPPVPPTPRAEAVVTQIAEAEQRAAAVAFDLTGDAAAREAYTAGLARCFDAAGDAATDAQRAQALDAVASLPPLRRQARRASPQPLAPSAPLAPEAALHLGRRVREWLARGDCLAGRDLAGARLARMDFAGADLRETMFEQADLAGASFRGADLRGAVFTAADLTGADFTGADLTGANLARARAAGAVFRDARLSQALAAHADFARADFRGARLDALVAPQLQLTGALLEETDLTQALLIEASAAGASFARARLDRTVLLGADLNGADFSAARIERSVLLHASAPESRWRGAQLERMQTGGKASFVRADLRDVVARECGWRGADLRHADFSGARLALCDFGLCRLDGARLDGALLWRSIFMQATLAGASADGADFFQAMCRKADFRGVSLSDAGRAQADFTEALFGDAPPAEAEATVTA